MQVAWKHGGAATNASSPITADGKYLLPFGADKAEVKLEAGTHIHQLSSGDYVTFYAAATPGWVPNGNYTVGWLVLAAHDPTTILQRSQTHILIPTMDYETLCGGDPACKYQGERKNVIFASTAFRTPGTGTGSSSQQQPTGSTVDEFRLYFGGGDGNVGTAVIRIASTAS